MYKNKNGNNSDSRIMSNRKCGSTNNNIKRTVTSGPTVFGRRGSQSYERARKMMFAYAAA
jgi:hypothetical protein